MSPPLHGLSPAAVLARVAAAIPAEVHEHIVIVGSIAAAYHLLRPGSGHAVRTKDIDCVLVPHVHAVDSGRRIARTLLDAGWVHQLDPRFPAPGSTGTPVEELPVLRLVPPDEKEWFLELLGDPEGEAQDRRRWDRVEVPGVGHFGLPSFPFMGIATFDAARSDSGLRCALPAAMALAHLLEHREVRDDVIAGSDWNGRQQRRRNKDLGRVLSVAALSSPAAIEGWSVPWSRALRARFPSHWPRLAHTAGEGLRRLLASDEDLEEAAHHVNTGLLAGGPMRPEELRAVGQRILEFALVPLAETAPRAEGGA